MTKLSTYYNMDVLKTYDCATTYSMLQLLKHTAITSYVPSTVRTCAYVTVLLRQRIPWKYPS